MTTYCRKPRCEHLASSDVYCLKHDCPVAKGAKACGSHKVTVEYEQPNLYDQTGGQGASELLQRAYRFRRENRAAFAFLVSLIRQAKEDGKTIGSGYLREMVRKESAQVTVEQYTFPNALMAPLIRIAEEEHPELKGTVRTARSKVDGCLLGRS